MDIFSIIRVNKFCGSDDMQYRSTFSTEAHSVILLNDLYMDSSVSSGFTNFAICGSDDMYNTLYNLHMYLFCRTPYPR